MSDDTVTCYAIMRLEKLKKWSKLAEVEGHLTRGHDTPNANPKIDNPWMVGNGHVAQEVRARIGDCKIRANGVLAIQFLLTASAEYYRPATPSQPGSYDPFRLDALVECAMGWLQGEFGNLNIVSVVAHVDEVTPHLHAVVVPLDPVSGRLNASRWLDGKSKLRRLQDTYAKACGPLGLARGIQGSKAGHIRIAQHYAVVNAAVAPALPPLAVRTPPAMMLESSRAAWAAEESARIDASLRPVLQPLAEMAAEAQLARRKQRQAEATARAAQQELERMRGQAELVVDIPLDAVLSKAGYTLCRQYDENEWEGPLGRISIERREGKAILRQGNCEATGAVDLIMRLERLDFREAVAWLADGIGVPEAISAAMAHARHEAEAAARRPVPLPEPDPATWPGVRRHLIEARGLAAGMVDRLHGEGRIFSNSRGDAVFLHGHGGKAAGAELLGTDMGTPWWGFRGRKSVFQVRSPGNRELGICASALDALSYFQQHAGRRDAVSVGIMDVGAAGAVARKAIAGGWTVFAALGRDQAEMRAVEELMSAVPGIRRDTPERATWNEDLRARAIHAGGSPGGEMGLESEFRMP